MEVVGAIFFILIYFFNLFAAHRVSGKKVEVVKVALLQLIPFVAIIFFVGNITARRKVIFSSDHSKS